MSASNQLTSGFDFGEAIDLAELTRRADQIFAHGAARDTKEMYNVLFTDAAWTCVFATSGGSQQARALILKNPVRPLFALILAGPSISDRPQPIMPSQPTVNDIVQTIEVTNLVADTPVAPRLDHKKAAEAEEYLPLTGERLPPPRGARVYARWLKAVAAIQDEIELYFNEALNQLAAGFEIYITGHGTGGCLAALCTLRLKRKWELRIDFPTFNLKMYNFGSPKIGNKVFVEYYNQQLQGFSYRVQNLLDATTYEPMTQAPFPYNLPLLLPGVDYVRQGDEYFTAYEHIGEACMLPGLGNPTQAFHFRNRSKPLLPLPFAHDPEGYHAMLSEARDRHTALLVPAQQMLAKLKGQKNHFLAKFKQQSAQFQKVVAQFQDKPNP